MGAETPELIPILASSRYVFFPHTHLSIHIPRSFYEQIEQCPLAVDRSLGIVLRNVPLTDRVRILPIGCVGKIVQVHLLPCGRGVHLDLHGVQRFRIANECFIKGYSCAWVEKIADLPQMLAPEKKRYLLKILKEARRPHWDPENDGEIDEGFLNQLCTSSDLSPMDKYFLLEAETPNDRCGRFADLLRFNAEGIGFTSPDRNG